jgi:RNA polymerase I-specific transcription initiation factor RRN7
VHDKHLPEDLLGVVRDLWDLRIRGFSSPTSSSTSEVLVSGEGKQNKEDPAALSADVSDELAFFASQSGADASETEQRASIARTKVQDWTCGRPDDWKPPKIIETLAMSYLGCLLMRLPVRIGDIFRWAKANEIPYLGAVSLIRPPFSLSRLCSGRQPNQRSGHRLARSPRTCAIDCPGRIIYL